MRRWLADTAERTVATYLQVFVGLLIAAGIGTPHVDTLSVAMTAAVSAIPAALAVLKAALASRFGAADSASLVTADAAPRISAKQVAAVTATVQAVEAALERLAKQADGPAEPSGPLASITVSRVGNTTAGDILPGPAAGDRTSGTPTVPEPQYRDATPGVAS